MKKHICAAFILSIYILSLSGCSSNVSSANMSNLKSSSETFIEFPETTIQSNFSTDETSENITQKEITTNVSADTTVVTSGEIEKITETIVTVSDKVTEIKDKMFIGQTNDIYANAPDYLGTAIKYEGIYTVYESVESDNKYDYVIRYGPGCCGMDGTAGFEIVWDGEYPELDSWVEVVGILEDYIDEGFKYLRLRVTSLTVMETRGEEFVYQ